MIEEKTDPYGINQHAPGAKMDEGKVLAGILSEFSLALTEVAKVCTYGAHKYTRGGWQVIPDADLRYKDALFRHLLAEANEKNDPDSELRHLSHVAWNALARLELELRLDVSKRIR